MNQQSLSSFIWSVADLLRGDYKQSDYGKGVPCDERVSALLRQLPTPHNLSAKR